jgi:hypothetical protein
LHRGHPALQDATALGTVNALRLCRRSASTARSARPSGIDRACAQRSTRQLRDGPDQRAKRRPLKRVAADIRNPYSNSMSLIGALR